MLPVLIEFVFFFLRILRPPRSTRTYALFPYTTLFRSQATIPAAVGAPSVRPISSPGRSGAPWRSRWSTKPLMATPIRLLGQRRSEEHTSEPQSLMRISYAVFCLQKKKNPLIGNPRISKMHTSEPQANHHTPYTQH